MTDNAVHVSPVTAPVSPKAAGFGARHRRSFAVVIVIGVLMAILAPLQTDNISFWPRLAYWQILMLSGAIIALGISEGIEHWRKLRSYPWIEVPVIGLLIALPLTLIVIGCSGLFFGISTPGTVRFSYNFGVTAAISIAVTALNYMLHRAAPAPVAGSAPAPLADATQHPEPNRFAERLPLGLRSLNVIALEAEDHYLRVHLSGGQSTLILMRLSDAIAELPADKGAQTHRSWWVAKDAVQSVTKADGRATLMLDAELQAPVSRSFYKALNDAGWFR
jgi:hypothetical protein